LPSAGGEAIDRGSVPYVIPDAIVRPAPDATGRGNPPDEPEPRPTTPTVVTPGPSTPVPRAEPQPPTPVVATPRPPPPEPARLTPAKIDRGPATGSDGRRGLGAALGRAASALGLTGGGRADVGDRGHSARSPGRGPQAAAARDAPNRGGSHVGQGATRGSEAGGSRGGGKGGGNGKGGNNGNGNGNGGKGGGNGGRK
jgi:hypothetical protein